MFLILVFRFVFDFWFGVFLGFRFLGQGAGSRPAILHTEDRYRYPCVHAIWKIMVLYFPLTSLLPDQDRLTSNVLSFSFPAPASAFGLILFESLTAFAGGILLSIFSFPGNSTL